MPCPEQLESLLGADEVGSALGEPVRPPACIPLGPEAHICLWRPVTGRHGSLTLTIVVGALAAHTLRVERRFGLAVAGLGEEGYLRDRARPVCVLRRGRRVLKLVLSGSRAPDPAAAVVRLARLAAERLSPQDVLPDHPEQAG